MPAPGAPTFHAVNTLVPIHTALKNLIDTGSAGLLKLYTSGDTLLGSITLTDPCGTVHSSTGQLTITQASNGAGVAAGTAAYGTLTDSSGTVYFSADTQSGTAAVAGKIVINTLTVAIGSPLALVSCTIG